MVWIGQPPACAVDLNDIHRLLQNRRRRWVLAALTDEDELRIGELSERIAAIENDTPRRLLDSQQRKRVYVGLYQCHLDQLADENVIEWEKSRGIVRRGPEYWAVRWVQQAGGQIQSDEEAA